MKFEFTQDDIDLLEPLQPGVYDAYVKNIVNLTAEGEPLTSSTGKPMVMWEFAVKMAKGEKTFRQWTVIEKGSDFAFRKTLSAVLKGIPTTGDTSELIGKPIRLLLGLQPDKQGLLSNEIVSVLPPKE